MTISQDRPRSPQDPYRSFIVSASAGCGKTYQLSRRFLYLIGAGAKPSEVLAITFTKKAASEMSQRIISDAANLIYDHQRAAEFDQQLRLFHQQFCQQTTHAQLPPRSAVETGQLILSSTQQLRVTTIDSTFWEWVRKFSWEASGLAEGNGAAQLPSGFELLSKKEASDIHAQAFGRLVNQLFVNSNIELPESFFVNQGLYGLQNRFDQLQSFATYLWLQRRLRGGAAPLNPFVSSDLLPGDCDEQTIMEMLRAPLSDILPVLGAGIATTVKAALDRSSWDDLWQSKFITKKDARISGTYLRGKKREALADAVTVCEQLVADFVNLKNIAHLNQLGTFLLELFHGYANIRDELKFQDGKIEFEDLAKGCFRLFHDVDAVGARFLINQTTRHLLLDEFQDTSRLQWSVFSPLATELLSGEGAQRSASNISPSVFVVGDVKQSIYGFREADPSVLKEAAEELAPFGLQSLPLNLSYRTAPSLMRFINQVFSHTIPDFPEHATACDHQDQPVVPDCGWIKGFGLFQACEERSGAENEAQAIADYLAETLDRPDAHPVFDRSLGGYRPLQARDITLLYRNSTRAHLFENALRERGLACIREQPDGFFGRQESLDLCALVRWLAYPSDGVALMQVMASPIGEIADQSVLRILDGMAEQELGSGQRNIACVKGLAEDGIRSAAQLLQWLQDSKTSRPASLCERIISERGLPHRYSQHFGPGEGDLAAANIMQFLELIWHLDSDGQQSWQTLDRSLADLVSQGQVRNAPTSSDAISLMTIHKSKGLEFPMVVLVDAGGQWEKRDRYWVKGRHAEYGDGVYYTGSQAEQPVRHMEFENVHKKIDSQLREESYRLLYVALTRAKQYLAVSGHKPARISDNQSLAASGFLGEVRQALTALSGVEAGEHQASGLDFRRAVDWVTAPPPVTQTITDPRLPSPDLSEIITVSAHALDRTDETSSKGYVSSGLDAEYARLRGLLVHAGLEAFVKNQPFAPEQCWRTFNPEPAYTGQYEAILTSARLEIDKVVNSAMFRDLTAPPNNAAAEVPICVLRHGNQLLRGRIDLLIETSGADLIIDYKTQSENLDPQHFYHQLASYCEAWQQITAGNKAVEGHVFYTGELKLEKVWPRVP